jgi:hypothetical protein
MISTIRPTLLLALLGVLAACGNAVPATQRPPTAAPVVGLPTARALPTTAPTSPSTAAATTSPATKLPVATAVAPQPTAANAALAEGLTPEGYHFLGRADAPATLVMYSDFL